VALKSDAAAEKVQTSIFARFLGLFDFRLLQQYLHLADIGPVMFDARYRG